MPLVSQQSVAERPLRIMLYGGSGSGKTIAATSPALDPDTMGKVLVINYDDGLMSAAHYAYLFYTYNVEDYEDLRILRDILRQPPADRPEPYNEVGTVVIDSYTQMLDTLMWERTHDGQGNKTHHPTFSDWNWMMEQVESFVKAVTYDHLILTAERKSMPDEENDAGRYYPQMNPAMQRRTLHLMDLIIYMNKKRGYSRMHIEDDNSTYKAKVRNAQFYEKLKDWTFEHNLKQVEDERTRETMRKRREATSTVILRDRDDIPIIPMIVQVYKEHLDSLK